MVSARWVCRRVFGAAGQFGCAGHQLPGHRERRTRADRDLDARIGGRVVVGVDRGFGCEQRGFGVLDDPVRREAALADASVHRAAHQVQARADPVGGLDQRGYLVAAVAGEDVVVVGDGGAAGQREPRHARGGCRVGDLGVEPAPDRVQRDQPLEQGRVLRVAAGRPLVEVVVGVDETGRDQAAACVDVRRARVGGRRPVADGQDAVVLDDRRGRTRTRSAHRPLWISRHCR